MLLEEKHLFSVSPCWRTAFISESQLDVASLEFYPDEHKSLCISNCFNRGSHQCSMKPLRKTGIHVHFSPDKSLLYHKTPLTTLETRSSTAKKTQDIAPCDCNTPVIQSLLALTAVFSDGDRQVKYDKPMAWSLSPSVPSDDKCSSELLRRRLHDNGQSTGFQALSQYHSSL